MPTTADETAVNGPPAIDAGLARRLVDAQFPQWAGLPLRLVEPAGSDHVIYRLGGELSVRLPRLAPCLPLAVPVPLGVGEPAFGYPWPWAVSVPASPRRPPARSPQRSPIAWEVADD